MAHFDLRHLFPARYGLPDERPQRVGRSVEVVRPQALEEALALKSVRPDAVPLAGGTDLLVDLNFDRLRPETILDLSLVPELTNFSSGDVVELGASTTFARIVREGRWPAMMEAARTVGSPQIRNRATIGGNLGTASPAGDSIPVLYAYDAEVVVGREGTDPRAVRVEDFFIGPRRTTLKPHELILGVRWEHVEGPSVFSKIGTRNAMVIAVANLCLVIDLRRRTSRIALGSVGPTVLRARAAERMLDLALEGLGFWEGTYAPPAPDAVAAVADEVASAASPIDDIRGTARYRRHACRVLATRAIRWACSAPTENAAAS